MWAYGLSVQKWGMLLWNKWRYRYLPNAIVALQPLKRNFSEFCGLFPYQALLSILILCLCNKQLIFFPNMFLKGPLGFFSMQHPHQKIINTGGLHLCRGAWHSKIWQKLSLFMVCHISIRWAWSFVWGLSPPKSSHLNRTASMTSRNRVLKIVEYSPSCSSMEYCYSSFSLRQEFFISLGQNIVFWAPWLTFLWQYEVIGTTNLFWCFASADSKPITEHGKFMCVPIRQRVQLLCLQ